MPTNLPTSVPTSAPTMTNLVTANFLDTALTAAVVREKTKYYLVFYVAYFLGWYVLLYIAGYSRIGKDKASELYRVSHKKGSYKTCAKQTDEASRHAGTAVSMLKEIYSNNKRLKAILKMVSTYRCFMESLLTRNNFRTKKSGYSKSKKSLLMQRTMIVARSTMPFQLMKSPRLR